MLDQEYRCSRGRPSPLESAVRTGVISPSMPRRADQIATVHGSLEGAGEIVGVAWIERSVTEPDAALEAWLMPPLAKAAEFVAHLT